ncbi:MAG: hypothetical protein LLF93_03250 [Bacteroidales bacterium]|nr:hypothetical protein [Bacteroidales bacterium]
MFKKATIILFVLLAIAIAAISVSSGIIKRQKLEVRRLEKNQNALLSGIETYKAKNGVLAYSIKQLVLTNSELKRDKGDLARVVNNLKIRLRDVQTISTTVTQTQVETPAVPLKDSTIEVGGKIEPAKTFSWSDSWCKMSGVVYSDSAKVSYKGSDSLYTVGHRVRYRFLFFRFGTKEIRQTVTNTNPNTKIIYNEIVKLE